MGEQNGGTEMAAMEAAKQMKMNGRPKEEGGNGGTAQKWEKHKEKEAEKEKDEQFKLKEEEGADCWYQFPLPKPPLPSLKHTLGRYLEYASVLAQTYGLDMERTTKCVDEFERNYGGIMEKRLAELAQKEENWINLFWLPEMYLRQRLPLPLNFNPAYIFPRQHFPTDLRRLQYASWLVRGFLDFKARVDKKKIPRETVPDRFLAPGQTVRMCMDQYERILNFYRQPGKCEDILHDRRQRKGQKRQMENGNGERDGGEKDGEEEEEEEEEHILVLSDSLAFILFTKWQGQPLSAHQITAQLVKIRRMARNRSAQAAIPIAGAGTGKRDGASQFWEEMVKDPANQCSLEWVRSSIFALCLDDDYDCGDNHSDDKRNKMMTAKERDGHQILHGFGPKGNGLNRWFDATIQLIVSGNGCCGLCIEHSVAEGIVYIKMTEEVIKFANENWAAMQKEEIIDQQQKEPFPCNPLAAASSSFPVPTPLSWAVSATASTLLQQQIAQFDELANDLHLRVLEFNDFGKNSIKSWHVSPDGFVQLCMQLAHYKLHGFLVSSYESATMRRFRLGRVDNIRAATPEALKWVKAMEDQNERKERQNALFMEAARKQALITRENVIGHGIDNHLCALEVLTREFIGHSNSDKIPELFREPMWKEMMRFPLSTSQVTTSSAIQFTDCYLCYGPVVRDGYGCAYNIQPERIIFAVSTWKSDSRTNADAFRLKLKESLADMRQLLELGK